MLQEQTALEARIHSLSESIALLGTEAHANSKRIAEVTLLRSYEARRFC